MNQVGHILFTGDGWNSHVGLAPIALAGALASGAGSASTKQSIRECNLGYQEAECDGQPHHHHVEHEAPP